MAARSRSRPSTSSSRNRARHATPRHATPRHDAAPRSTEPHTCGPHMPVWWINDFVAFRTVLSYCAGVCSHQSPALRLRPCAARHPESRRCTASELRIHMTTRVSTRMLACVSPIPHSSRTGTGDSTRECLWAAPAGIAREGAGIKRRSHQTCFGAPSP